MEDTSNVAELDQAEAKLAEAEAAVDSFKTEAEELFGKVESLQAERTAVLASFKEQMNEIGEAHAAASQELEHLEGEARKARQVVAALKGEAEMPGEAQTVGGE